MILLLFIDARFLNNPFLIKFINFCLKKILFFGNEILLAHPVGIFGCLLLVGYGPFPGHCPVSSGEGRFDVQWEAQREHESEAVRPRQLGFVWIRIILL